MGVSEPYDYADGLLCCHCECDIRKVLNGKANRLWMDADSFIAHFKVEHAGRHLDEEIIRWRFSPASQPKDAA